MNNLPQIVATLILLALGGGGAWLLFNQFHLRKVAQKTAELEQNYLRERIALITEQRRIQREKFEGSWNGFRKFRIADKVVEAEDVCSFYLSPHDGKPLPPFDPGQYLTFQIRLPGQPKPFVRCYSLSERPGLPERYRVTIKRVPGGLASNHFHDRLKVGDIVDVKAPAGQFVLDLQQQTPVVLISGGVGITPVLSMLNTLAADGMRREAWFFHGVRHGREHMMKDHLQSLAAKFPSLHLNICYSQPSDEDRAAVPPAFQHNERVSLELLQRVLPSNKFDFFLCGPPAMMSDLAQGLKLWGVTEDHIFFEAFGAATVRKPALQQNTTTTVALKIQFARAGKSHGWNPDAGSLLDFARQHGVTIESGCRAGNCGTCLVAIKSGEVNYLREPGVTVEQGSCLTCIAVPKTALVLDA